MPSWFAVIVFVIASFAWFSLPASVTFTVICWTFCLPLVLRMNGNRVANVVSGTINCVSSLAVSAARRQHADDRQAQVRPDRS